jgi:hypothetical protein
MLVFSGGFSDLGPIDVSDAINVLLNNTDWQKRK